MKEGVPMFWGQVLASQFAFIFYSYETRKDVSKKKYCPLNTWFWSLKLM